MLDRSDTNHEQAAGLWASLLEKDFYLCTGNYVIVGTLALLQSRLGSESGNLWYRDVLTLAETLRIDGSMPNLAYELWLSLQKLLRKNRPQKDILKKEKLTSNTSIRN